MKKLRIILGLIIVAIAFISCESDGGDSNIDTSNGVVPNFVKSSTSDSFINLVDLNEGNDIQLSFSFDIALGAAESADIIAFYSSGSNLYGPVTLRSGITEFPVDVTLSQDDLIAAFTELTSITDLQVGDILTISAKFYLADGTTLSLLNDDGSRNYGSDIHTSPNFTAQLLYPVACPSSLGGTYSVLSTGASTDSGPSASENPIANYPYTVVITDNGGGSYTISDGVAGLYILWYDIYGYTFETEGNFTDVCGNLQGSWTEAFGCQVDLTGTVNEDGTLTIQWVNCFGDFADAVYTLQ